MDKPTRDQFVAAVLGAAFALSFLCALWILFFVWR